MQTKKIHLTHIKPLSTSIQLGQCTKENAGYILWLVNKFLLIGTKMQALLYSFSFARLWSSALIFFLGYGYLHWLGIKLGPWLLMQCPNGLLDWYRNNKKVAVRHPLTGGRRRSPTVTLNKSPAWVLSGNDFIPTDSFPLLLIDFFCPYFVFLHMTLFWDDFELEAGGDTLADFPLSAPSDNSARLSGFCIQKLQLGLVNSIIRTEATASVKICVWVRVRAKRLSQSFISLKILNMKMAECPQ